MKKSSCVVTSILVAAAMVPIGFNIAQADNGNHGELNDGIGMFRGSGSSDIFGLDKQKPKHSQNAQLTRNDHDKDDNNGKHANGENHNPRHNQTGQLTRNDHDKDDNNGKHVGWHKHLGTPTSGDHPTASVPEPASLVLLGAGIAGIGFLRRMSRKV